MAEKTFAIYVKDEGLYSRVRELQEQGAFQVKDICNDALRRAVETADKGLPLDLSQPDDAKQLTDDAGQIEYTLQYQPNFAATQAMIDNVRDQGGWTIGFTKDTVSEGFYLLFGHPRVLSDD